MSFWKASGRMGMVKPLRSSVSDTMAPAPPDTVMTTVLLPRGMGDVTRMPHTAEVSSTSCVWITPYLANTAS